MSSSTNVPLFSPSHSVETLVTSRRVRLLIGALFAVLCAILLSSCTKTDSTTALNADGSGTHTITVTTEASYMEKVEGGVSAVEAVINDNNPGGITYSGADSNSERTVFTFVIEFSGPDDYEAKAKTLLEAGGITTTPEVLFTPPTPPFSGGYTFNRNFTDQELLTWASEALIDSGAVGDDMSTGQLFSGGSATVTADGEELEKDYEHGWTNATNRSFSEVTVTTQGLEDPEADSYTRTIVYELPRETYLDASDEFDTFFAEATPEGGELTPAGDAGTTWTIVFPAGSAADVATWTDAALATTGTEFTVESSQSEDDPFTFETLVVDSIECSVACSSSGYLYQYFELPANGSGSAEGDGETSTVEHPGGPEPYSIERTVPVESTAVDVEVNREGGGKATIVMSLTEENDAAVTEDRIIAWMGEGAERGAEGDLVTYTLTAEGADSAEFVSALQKVGFTGYESSAPLVEAHEYDSRKYSVAIDLVLPEHIATHVPGSLTWTVTGDGLKPTIIGESMNESASLGEDSIVVKDDTSGYLSLVFDAEQTGLPMITIVAIVIALALLGLMIAAAVIGFLYRSKIKALVAGKSGASSADTAEGAEGAAGGAATGAAAAPTEAPTEQIPPGEPTEQLPSDASAQNPQADGAQAPGPEDPTQGPSTPPQS